MGDFKRCPKCDEYGWFGGTFRGHVCPPVWECRMDTEDDDCWAEVFARDSETAAEKHAEEYDRADSDYPVLNRRWPRHGGDFVCYVRKPVDEDFIGPPHVEMWQIEAEAVPHYYAERHEP